MIGKGSWNPYEQLGYLNKLSNINVPTIGLYKKIAKFISTDFWVLDCYSQLKNNNWNKRFVLGIWSSFGPRSKANN